MPLYLLPTKKELNNEIIKPKGFIPMIFNQVNNEVKNVNNTFPHATLVSYAKWIVKLNKYGWGVLHIETPLIENIYLVQKLLTDSSILDNKPKIKGFRLWKDDTFYDLLINENYTNWSCTCADYVYRRAESETKKYCKHILSIHQLILDLINQEE